MSTTSAPRRVRGTTRGSASPVVRVAIYTRKSVDKGERDEFNSIESQREAIESYIASQAGLGWIALPVRYDDLGVSGATTNRPAFQRLLADVCAAKVDVVAVYKIDRFSRSLKDFAQLAALFEEHNASFVSITQSFDTATSMGRLTLNILMSFAEFERETTAERVSDKMAASRRKGMHTGGRPILGFDFIDKALVVNKDEAEQVRTIYALYLEHRSYLAVLAELDARGWRNKSFTNKRDELIVGGPFNKSSLPRLLRDPRYIGMVAEGGELYDGKHKAIVDRETWDSVQALLDERQQRGRKRERHVPTLLAGLVRCGVCGAAMGHHTTRRHGRHYSYYTCATIQKRGAKACPGSRVPSAQLDEEIMKRVCLIGRDDALIEATALAAQEERDSQRKALTADRRRLKTRRSQLEAERARLQAADQNGHTADRLVSIANEIEDAIRAQGDAGAALKALAAVPADEDSLRTALATLDGIWDSLFPHERARLLGLLIREVRVIGATGEVEIDIRDTGIESLREELADEVVE